MRHEVDTESFRIHVIEDDTGKLIVKVHMLVGGAEYLPRGYMLGSNMLICKPTGMKYEPVA